MNALVIVEAVRNSRIVARFCWPIEVSPREGFAMVSEGLARMKQAPDFISARVEH